MLSEKEVIESLNHILLIKKFLKNTVQQLENDIEGKVNLHNDYSLDFHVSSGIEYLYECFPKDLLQSKLESKSVSYGTDVTEELYFKALNTNFYGLKSWGGNL